MSTPPRVVSQPAPPAARPTVVVAAQPAPPPPVVVRPAIQEQVVAEPNDVYISAALDSDIVFVGGSTYIWVTGSDGHRHRHFYAHGDRRQEIFHRRDNLHSVMAHRGGPPPAHYSAREQTARLEAIRHDQLRREQQAHIARAQAANRAQNDAANRAVERAHADARAHGAHPGSVPNAHVAGNGGQPHADPHHGPVPGQGHAIHEASAERPMPAHRQAEGNMPE
ncbi:hypothetical protein [Pararobbsia alpina]|uniref:hypothetical protein n=1 Tax=Pararobbsia alpina TaxID=621374 RepID=UPI0039A46DF5